MNKKIELNITGMTCASCAASIDRQLKKMAGIISVQINFARKKALVEFDEKITDKEKIIEAIASAGYGAQEEVTGTDHSHHHMEDVKKTLQDFFWSAIFSLPLILGMIMSFNTGVNLAGLDLAVWVNLILASIVVWFFGWRFHKMAWKLARKFSANMDTLISLGTLTAYFYSLWVVFQGQEGYFETASIIIVLFFWENFLKPEARIAPDSRCGSFWRFGRK
jgi:Cu+-exporting ATPase